MARGKLIVIEGTDCSGKETQTKKLISYLNKKGEKVINYSFPMYDTPTGRIVGGPYLGKEAICNGWFPEGAASVDAKVASLYYAADRLYNINIINEKLDEGYDVILDRYVESSMAHQGGKIADKQKRLAMYQYIENLEFELLGLPRPDAVILLYMPVEAARVLRQNRTEKLDELERDENHLKLAESAYLELSKMYDYSVVNCAEDGRIKTIDEISDEVINTYENLTLCNIKKRNK